MSAPSRLLRIVCIALPLFSMLTGCVVATPRRAEIEVVAPHAPPPPRVELAPPAPGGRAEAVFWVPGRWHWDGREWVWRAGHYEERPFRRAEWVAGHWAERPNGSWVWVEGRWR
jgi:WXXGXW repeat (2 copies)